MMENSPDRPHPLQHFTQHKIRLLHCLDEYLALERSDATSCLTLRTKLAEERFTVAALGQFKRGKSCLINAMLGEDLLPVGSIPLTSVAVSLHFSDHEVCNLHYQDGRVTAIQRQELTDYATEAGNPGNAKQVHEVTLGYPSELLRDGVSLLDTPGVGSLHAHNTLAAKAVLPRCDAALFLLSADQPLGQEELDYLQEIRAYAQRIFFVLNKIDYLNGAELTQTCQFVQQHLQKTMQGEVKFYPVSAKLALQGQKSANLSLLSASRLPALTADLEAFLLHEKGTLLIRSVCAAYTSLLNQARLEIQLEQQAANLDPAELAQKIQKFQGKRKSLAPEKRRLRQQIQLEFHRIIGQVLEPEIQQFRAALEGNLPQALREFGQNHSPCLLRALDTALDQFSQKALQENLAQWQLATETKLTEELLSLSQRFSRQTSGLIDELQQFAAQLMNIPYETQPSLEARLPTPGHYEIFEAEPLALELISQTVALDWPDRISERFPKLKASAQRWAKKRLLSQHRENLLESIDRQCGRVRYELLERLERAAAQFAESDWNRFETAALGLATALDNGKNDQLLQADNAKSKTQQLAQEWIVITKSEQELAEILAAQTDK